MFAQRGRRGGRQTLINHNQHAQERRAAYTPHPRSYEHLSRILSERFALEQHSWYKVQGTVNG